MATKTYLDKTGLTHYDELIKAKITKKQNKIQLATLPTLTADYAGETFVQYVGETTEDYTQGDFYKADLTELEWVKQTYNKAEVDSLMTTSGGFVACYTLPTTDILENKIYLVSPGTRRVVGYKDTSVSPAVWWVKLEMSSAPLGYVYRCVKLSDDGRYYGHNGGADKDTAEDITAVETAIATGIYSAEYIDVNWQFFSSSDNIDMFDEYVYVTQGYSTGAGRWEKIGSTEMNLTDYVKFTDLTAITTAEIDALFE